jgi:hypothetical protein
VTGDAASGRVLPPPVELGDNPTPMMAAAHEAYVASGDVLSPRLIHAPDYRSIIRAGPAGAMAGKGG